MSQSWLTMGEKNTIYSYTSHIAILFIFWSRFNLRNKCWVFGIWDREEIYDLSVFFHKQNGKAICILIVKCINSSPNVASQEQDFQKLFSLEKHLRFLPSIELQQKLWIKKKRNQHELLLGSQKEYSGLFWISHVNCHKEFFFYFLLCVLKPPCLSRDLFSDIHFTATFLEPSHRNCSCIFSQIPPFDSHFPTF